MKIEFVIIVVQLFVILFTLSYLYSIRQRQKKVAQELNLKDELTGDLKREAMLKLGLLIFQDMKNRAGTLSIALIDLDNFSAINKQFGTSVGDDVIKLVSETLHTQKRQSDYLCRWSGQGWLLLLPETPVKRAERIFERVQLALYEQDFAIPDEWTVTISMGISEMVLSDESFEDIVKRADTALFKAKKAGKNRIEVYEIKGE